MSLPGSSCETLGKSLHPTEPVFSSEKYRQENLSIQKRGKPNENRVQCLA